MHAAPFYCPYCAEETLEPSDPSAPPGAEKPAPSEAGDARSPGWYCSSCDRRFSLKFQGLGAPASAESA